MFEEKTIKETERALGTDIEVGLTQREAKRRLSEGTNELIGEEKKTFFGMFMEQLADPLIYVLMGAGVISAFLGDMAGRRNHPFCHPFKCLCGMRSGGKSSKGVGSFAENDKSRCFCKTGGAGAAILWPWDLVPGDLVVLEAGMQVPADIRLTKAVRAMADESALTGESVPVRKDAGFTAGESLPIGDRKNMAFSSTYLVYGRAEGIVTATGMDTESWHDRPRAESGEAGNDASGRNVWQIWENGCPLRQWGSVPPFLHWRSCRNGIFLICF